MIWAALIGKVRGWAIGAGAVLAGLFLAYFKGRKDIEQKHKAEELNEYVETRKRMDAANPDDDVDFLLKRKRKRNL